MPGRIDAQKILEDYSELVNNRFWIEFLDYIEKESQETLRQLSKESYTEQKLRYWQGAYRALMLVHKEYPERLLNELRREIDK